MAKFVRWTLAAYSPFLLDKDCDLPGFLVCLEGEQELCPVLEDQHILLSKVEQIIKIILTLPSKSHHSFLQNIDSKPSSLSA